VGARRGPAAAAATGGVAGKEGSRLANKRRLCLTCELGEALGVSAGDENLGKKEARSSSGHGGDSGNGGLREGGAALNRGGSAGDDDSVTVKMRPWYWRPRPTRVQWGAGRTGGPWRAPDRVRRGRRRRVARGAFKEPRGAGMWGRRTARAVCGHGHRGGRRSSAKRGARARGRTRRRGAVALWLDNVSMCPCLNTNISKHLTRSAQSFEYESCRAHLGEYFS
jgi:hypothetical protein